MIESMLTTIDNPHSPFTHYDAWLSFDLRSGYNTNEFLARILYTSDELSEADQHQAIEDAIDEIVRENVTGVYTKVTREVPDFTETSGPDP